MFYLILALYFLLLFLYWIWKIFFKEGKINFWKVASKYPDLAYEYFQRDDRWKVFENQLPSNIEEIVPHENWVGPFRLIVPKLGNSIIYVYGLVKEIHQAQDEFLRNLSDIKDLKV